MKLRNRWIVIGVILIVFILGIGSVIILKLRGASQRYPISISAPSGLSSLNLGGRGSSRGESGPGSIAFATAHLTPILFYGKVVDQDGNPVAGADVEYVGNSIPWGGGVRRQTKSDVTGEFQITSTGISLFVDVTKENYRTLLRRSDIAPAEAVGDPSSSDSFNYANLFGPIVHRPDKAHPVRFTLYKSGVLEPLIVEKGKDLVMEKDGTPIRVHLQPGNPKTVIDLQCWTYDQTLNPERHYDWNFKMTIPTGAMVECPKGIAFSAPTSGYEQKVFEYSMAKEIPRDQWKDEVAKRFFVRFEDDTYAVLDVKMISGGGHFAVVAFILNPKTGSKNLETAPPEKPKYR